MSAESQLEMVLRPNVLPFVLGALAIVVFGVAGLLRSFLEHRERMAMIRAGIHPDAAEGSSESNPSKPVAVKSKTVATQENAWSDWSPPKG